MARRNPKALKAANQRRMRAAYLKPYDIASYVHVKARGPALADIPEDQIAYFAYRKRGNSFWDPYLEAKFPSRGMVSAERQAVLAKIAEWSQLVLEEMNVIVHRGGITKTVTRLFFNSDYTVCFFTKEDYQQMLIYKSIEYRGGGARERAYFAFNHNQIAWLEVTNLAKLNEQPG